RNQTLGYGVMIRWQISMTILHHFDSDPTSMAMIKCSLFILALAVSTSGVHCADPSEFEAIQAVMKLGGTVKHDEKAQGRPVVYVSVQARQVTDADLKDLLPFKRLQALELIDALVTDAGLKQLSKFKELRELNLENALISDAGLRELAAQRKNWQMLAFAGT